MNHVETDLLEIATDETAETDCPRFGETRTWVENFNLDEEAEEQEVVVENSAPTDSTYTVSGGSS